MQKSTFRERTAAAMRMGDDIVGVKLVAKQLQSKREGFLQLLTYTVFTAYLN